MPLLLDELVNHPDRVNRQAQVLDWVDLLFEYELALDDMQAWLRGLNEEQIHFKPAEKVYSIAEIVTHNSFSDEMFWSWVALLVQGRGAEIDPATFVEGDGAGNTAAVLDLEALNEACRALARHTIDTLPPTPDLAASAPHPYFGALNAKGWVYFLAWHRGVHRYQCERVIDAPGFPRSGSVQTQPREAYQPSDRKTWLKPVEARKPNGAPRGAQKPGNKKRNASATAAKKQAATKKKKTAARSN